jgi:hypothetical protein
VPAALAGCDRVQEWLLECNKARYSVYVSVNAIAKGTRSRTKRDVAAVRHVFLDVDRHAHEVLRQLQRRSDVPQPNYVVHTSPNRAHVLWRARGFDAAALERLQKALAAEMGGDLAATSVTQMTRVPGFWNHKYLEPYLVSVDYWEVERIYTPRDFSSINGGDSARKKPAAVQGMVSRLLGSPERARVYLSRVPPAVTGHHGDLHTFRTCCRIVRGFALDDDEALTVLAEWNARCQPPWSERELREKIRSARRNGREPVGGLL